MHKPLIESKFNFCTVDTEKKESLLLRAAVVAAAAAVAMKSLYHYIHFQANSHHARLHVNYIIFPIKYNSMAVSFQIEP